MINYAALKAILPIETVLRNYGIPVDRSKKFKCLHHTDATASCAIYGDHYYCFGCGKRGDILDIAAAVHGIDTKTAAELLVKDFGLSIGTEEAYYKHIQPAPKPQFNSEERRKMINAVWIVLTTYEKILQQWAKIYQPWYAVTPDPRYVAAVKRLQNIKQFLDSFIESSEEQQFQMALKLIRNKTIEKIENMEV